MPDSSSRVRKPLGRYFLLCAMFAISGYVFDTPLFAGDFSVSGPANVISGDTLEISGKTFRLFGIDAPGLGQSCQWPDKIIPCGDVSRTALMDLVVAAQVDCTAIDEGTHDADGAIVARCSVNGFDVGNNMVHTGWAIVASHESRAYQVTEDKARKAGRGLWHGEFELPWLWHANN